MGDWSAQKSIGPVAVASIHLRAADARGVVRCTYCAGAVRCADRHVDHVIPRRRRGPTTPENLVLACRRCNVGRHDDLPLRARLAGRTAEQVQAEIERQTSIPIGPGTEIHARAVEAAWRWWPSAMARRARAWTAHRARQSEARGREVFAFFEGLARARVAPLRSRAPERLAA